MLSLLRNQSRSGRGDVQSRVIGFVAFVVGGVHYAVDVSHVIQVANPMEVAPLPQMSPSVVGVAEFRGCVIPVVDLRICFGVPVETTRQTKWIVFNTAVGQVGLVVDAVSGVFTSNEGDLRQVPSVARFDAKQPLVGVAMKDGRMVFLVDASFLGELAKPAENVGVLALPALTKEVDGARDGGVIDVADGAVIDRSVRVLADVSDSCGSVGRAVVEPSEKTVVGCVAYCCERC